MDTVGASLNKAKWLYFYHTCRGKGSVHFHHVDLAHTHWSIPACNPGPTLFQHMIESRHFTLTQKKLKSIMEAGECHQYIIKGIGKIQHNNDKSVEVWQNCTETNRQSMPFVTHVVFCVGWSNELHILYWPYSTLLCHMTNIAHLGGVTWPILNSWGVTWPI